MSEFAKRLGRIVVGGGLLLVGVLLRTESQWIRLGIFLAAYIVVGVDIVVEAVCNIFKGEVFDENFLMSVATIGAFVIGEYPEGIGVMLFFQVGELFQEYAVDRSRKSITGLMGIRPDYANVKRGDDVVRVDPSEARVGDIVIVKAGERVPLDGRVVSGMSMIDTSALTGESVPREVLPGCDVLSGCINMNGLLAVEVTREYGESTVSKILKLVEDSADKKAKTENFITVFAKYYTPIVVALAALISVVPPLVISGATFGEWVYRGLTFLVISCPCALVVSIPLGFFGGIGGASRKGILIKGGNYLEALSRLETVVFDKTGTLTKGVFNVQEVRAAGMDSGDLLELAAYAESYSDHPISLSLKRAYGKEIDNSRIADAEVIPGCGIRAVIDGRTVYAGNAKLMNSLGITYKISDMAGTVVLIAADGVFAGYIIIADEMKDDAKSAVRSLKDAGIRKTVMLTGDAKSVGDMAASDLGLDLAYSELLPGDKVEKLEELLSQGSARGKLAFVGDGINDAPVLARADVGIAMGGLGSDAAIEAADIVIMTDEPSKIPLGIKISKRTIRIVRQNIVFALSFKLAVLALAALGLASMWAGVAADVGVALLAILNAARALKN